MSNYSNSNPSQQVKFNGLRNQGSTCYLNSVLQVLFMTEDFREAVERFAHDNPGTKFIDHQLNHLFDELKTDTAQTNKITDKLNIRQVYEQRDAAEYFEEILRLASSEASQIFHGTLTHRTICSNCEKPSDSDEKCWHLPLTLNSDPEYSVVDGISEFFRDTQYIGDDQIYCDICHENHDTTAKYVLKHPPEVLMLLLKRFELNIYNLTYFKNKRIVCVPSRLQIPENQTYDLYAFVEHSGELGSGHYSATIKSEEDDKWYKFNDTTVTSLDFQLFQSDDCMRSDGPYLLFYRKKHDQAADFCTLQDTGEKSTPEEYPPTSVDIYDQPHNSEILSKQQYVTHMSVSDHKQDVGVMSERQGNKHFDEIKLKETISTSRNSSQKVRKMHKYPLRERKTRENDRMDAVHFSNRFSPHARPAGKQMLIIGDSMVRNMKIAKSAGIVRCFPDARAGDIESYLKLLARRKPKFNRIVIHVGTNDSNLRQSEVTKVNVESVCAFAKTMSDTVIFSGPLPNLTSDEMYSRMSSFNRWLSRWCPANDVGFIDNWTSFWGKPGLIRRGGTHPTSAGVSLFSRNIAEYEL